MSIDPIRKLLSEKNDPALGDEMETVSQATLDALWEFGAFGLTTAPEYGGLGLSNTQLARLSEYIGRTDLGLGVVLGAHQSIGYKGISLFGTPEQKAKYLERVSIGKTYASFCLTEPSSGSDAGSIRSRAVKSADGKHYVLNGSKIWISNGGWADVFTVFAQTPVTDPETGEVKDKVTGFIVEREMGVKNGPPEKKMGIKCSNTTELYFDDVMIPVENVLGGEGNGFKVAMSILNNGRFGMSATLSGTMRHCIEKATEHATSRVQFGNHLSSYGGIQEKIARMNMMQYVTESMAFHVAGNMDRGSQDYHLEAAVSKIFGSEAAWYVCDEAIQILGGNGYMKANGLEKIMRDLRIYRIFEGANDILRLFVALTGIKYAGGHLKELQRAFKNPAANLGLIWEETSKRTKRAFGIHDVDLSTYVHPTLIESSKSAADCINLFGLTVENLLLKHNKNIVDRQWELNRLADAVIDIYAMSVILSRATKSITQKLDSADHEILMTNAFCVEASDRVRVNLKRISTFQTYFKDVQLIAENVYKAGTSPQSNPLNF